MDLSAPWMCPGCGERLAPEFTDCWNCGHIRGSGEPPERSEDDPAAESSPPVRNPMVCPNCRLKLDYAGTKKFHEGSRAAPFLLGELGELFVKREHFDVYVCPRCGRIEMFLDGLGEEFRPH